MIAQTESGRFRLDINKKVIAMRVVRYWMRLPREAVDALSMEVFKVRHNVTLSNMY